MAKVLITGAAGFIGSNLASALVARGHKVRAVDNLSCGHLENLRPLGDDVEFRCIDVRDADAMEEACKGVDYVFHEAAVASVALSIEKPRECDAINLGGTLNVLEAARLQKVKRVIFAASAATYGDQPGLPKSESSVTRPITPYGVQKLACEHYLHSYWRVYGLETVALRYFNVFGPKQDPSSPYSGVLSIFARKTIDREQVTIFGDGETSRDFTYIDNVVEANLLAMQASTEAVSGGLFNIATGRAITLKEALATIQAHFGQDIAPKFAPERLGDIRHSLADITLAKKVLGYQPKVSFEEGVERTLDWLQRAEAHTDTDVAVEISAQDS